LINADFQIGKKLRDILDLVEDCRFITKRGKKSLGIIAGEFPGKWVIETCISSGVGKFLL